MQNDKVEELYENRLIVLMEDIDSGCFHQVLLDHKQFKEISDAVVTIKTDEEGMKKGFEAVEVQIGTQEFPSDIFIGCKSIDEDHA